MDPGAASVLVTATCCVLCYVLVFGCNERTERCRCCGCCLLRSKELELSWVGRAMTTMAREMSLATDFHFSSSLIFLFGIRFNRASRENLPANPIERVKPKGLCARFKGLIGIPLVGRHL